MAWHSDGYIEIIVSHSLVRFLNGGSRLNLSHFHFLPFIVIFRFLGVSFTIRPYCVVLSYYWPELSFGPMGGGESDGYYDCARSNGLLQGMSN